MPTPAAAAAPRPNIIVILADDLGYADIGCFGAEIPTPVLDGLAARGVVQSQFYNNARCCPSRAALLTGRHPHCAGVGAMTVNHGYDSYRGFLRAEVPTIAERLRAAGYRTWMSGKWHVGGEYAVHMPSQWHCAGDAGHPLPTQRGFDRYYGTLAGAGSYFDPVALMDGDRFVKPTELPADYYLTTELGKRAAAFIDEVPTGTPFFGYLAFTAPHWPLHAHEADIAPFRDRYHDGWDKLRDERLAKQIALGLVPRSQTLSARDDKSHAWTEAKHRAWEAERMAVYAAQVASMDAAIGTVVERLRASRRLDDTLIMFMSDNGGCAEWLREDGKDGTWPEFYSLPTKTGTRCKVGNTPGKRPGPAETFMSYDLPWANASNTPFRKFKAWTHEGGISSPFVACWPRGLPAGATRHQPAHLIDLGPTLCGLAGADASGMDGTSVLGLWQSDAVPQRREPLCWEHQGHGAVRDGSLKIVRAGSDQPWELYDISADRIEAHDLSAADPATVQRLAAVWQRWADRCGVRPWPMQKKA